MEIEDRDIFINIIPLNNNIKVIYDNQNNIVATLIKSTIGNEEVVFSKNLFSRFDSDIIMKSIYNYLNLNNTIIETEKDKSENGNKKTI